MKKLTMILTVLILCLSFGSVQAAPTISLMPNATSVTQGDQIFIDVVLFYGVGDVQLISGALDFTYDAGLAGLSGFSFGPAVSALDSILPDTSTLGQINDFAFGDFGGIAAGTLASIVFDTTGAGTGAFDVFADPAFFGGWFDVNGAPFDSSQVVLSGTSVQINAVPIPGSLLLLGSGLVGLVGLGRKRKS